MGQGLTIIHLMVYSNEPQLDDTFFALSHPVRREIIARLAKGDDSVKGITGDLDESKSQITKHLHILERAGLLSRQKHGREHRLHFEPSPVEEINQWLETHQQFWLGRLDALDAHLAKVTKKK